MSGYKKTALNLSLDDKRKGIDWKHPEITIARQCELLNLSTTNFFIFVVSENPDMAV